MSCKIKEKLTGHLVENGAIDGTTNEILEYSTFEKLNNLYTEQAYNKYNVGNGRTDLFSPVTKDGKLIAEPKETLMDLLETSIDNYNKYNLTKVEKPIKQFSPEEVNYSLKVVDALVNMAKPKETKRTRKYGEKTAPERLTIRLNTINNPNLEANLRKTLYGKGVSSQQVDFLLDYMRENDIQEINTVDLALAIASEYSFSVEVNTATEDVSQWGRGEIEGYDFDAERFMLGDSTYEVTYDLDGDPNDIAYYKDSTEIEKDEYEQALMKAQEEYERGNSTIQPTKHYAQLTVPGGTEYRESEIATPLISPNIKGHGTFSTDNGIGWFRSDVAAKDTDSIDDADRKELQATGEWDKYTKQLATKTRRILEMQSDLFQKGRDKEELVGDANSVTDSDVVTQEYRVGEILYYATDDGEFYRNDLSIPFEASRNGRKNTQITEEEYYKNMPKDKNSVAQNTFLQFLNKDGNWVKFFAQSIVQDSDKKGFEKVLFPAGETAAKVEGHEAIADRIKNIDQKIVREKNYIKNKQYDYLTNKEKEENESSPYSTKVTKEDIENNILELEKSKQELKTQGIEKLAPIEGFYENRVQNTLKKLYGKKNVKRITDEHGNDWFEIDLSKVDSTNILLNRRKVKNLLDNSKESMFFLDDENSQERDPEHNTALSKHVLFDGKQGKFTVEEVLSNILKNYDNLSEDGRILLDKAKLLTNRSGAKIKFVSSSVLGEEENGMTPVMGYDSSTNEILISREVLEGLHPDEAVASFLHEVVHSVTVKAYTTPQTEAEKSFRDFIRAAYRAYRERSNGSTSYGFTNEAEFVAEAFTNPEFQRELQQLDSGSFWQNLLNLIRDILGLEKSQKFSNVIDSITDIVTQSEAEQSVGRDGGIYYKKASNESFTRPKTATIDDRLERTVTIMKGNLEQALNRSKASQKQSKGREEFQKNIQELIKTMDDYTDAKQWKSVTAYLKSLKGTIRILNERLEKEKANINKDDVLQTINSYEEYLATFDMVEEIEELISSARFSTSKVIDEKEIKKIKKSLKKIKGTHAELVNDFVAFKAEHMSKVLANNKYLTQVETDWRIKLEKEYRNSGIVSETMTEWVNRQMNTTYKDEIALDLEEKARDIVGGVDHDISKAVGIMADPLNTNGRLFQVVVNMVAGTRDRINKRIIDYDFKLAELKEKLEKEKGTKKPSELYKNILEQDKDGNWYVKGDYKIDLMSSLNHEYGNLKKTINDIENKYIQQGLTKAQYNKKKDFVEAKRAVSRWLKQNTISYGVLKDNDGNIIGKKRRAKTLWKNDLSQLSDTEREIVDTYRELIELTSKETKHRNSLIVERFDAKFYKLPSITKSDMERVVEKDAKGLRKDKFEDFAKIRVDDVEYSKEAVDGKGNPLRRLRVHFRGKLDPDQQSLDLLTMMRLERLNGINYDEKSKIEMQLKAIEDIAGHKEYFKKSKQTGGVLRNIFRQKEDVTTFKGKDGGNEYSRIKSYIEGAIYDNLHDSAGAINGTDLNKIIQTINGTTAFIGMSVNIGSGLANMTNGFSQLFIEAMGGDHISWKSLVKAEKKYTQDIPNILADLNNPVKKSFTNQVIQMFDVYGGFSVTNHPFLKDTLMKRFGNTQTLSGMQEMGEHMMQGILAMAVLDNLKVMNKDHKYVDKDGNVTTKKKAASYLDMLKKDDKGQLYMDENAVFSDHNLTTDYHDGGKAHINLLIKKKIHDTMGAYDPNFQNELYRTWYGKLLMMFKRFLIPGLQHRWKGVQTSFKKREDLEEHQLSYNTAIKEYEEGTYTTLIRFLRQGVIPMLKGLKLHHTKEYWNNMSEYERANLKKSTTEIVIAFAIVPLLAYLLELTFDDDEDDEALWFAAYQLRRLESELSQYLDISEAWRITSNPIAGTRTLQNVIEVVMDIATPWNWLDEDSKGQNEFIKDIKKITPIWVQLDKQWKQSYNFINNQAN